MAYKLIEAAHHAGARSTRPTWSPSSEPVPYSATAFSSNAHEHDAA